MTTRRRETSDFSSSFPKYVCARARPPKRVSIRAKWTNSRISLSPLSSLSENVSFGNAKIDIRDEQTLGMHFDFTSRQPFVYFQSKRSSQNLLQLQRRGENIQKGQIMLLVRSLKVCDSSESMWLSRVFYQRASSETFVHSVALRRARITEEGKNKEFIV